MSAASIEFHHVVKRYGQVTAVAGVSFSVAPGELVTLLGPSGCGKTTTLRMIAGLELPSEGSIKIAGQDVSQTPASGRDVSMVFQSYALFPHMTVLENVSYGLVVSGTPKAQAHEKARAVMQIVGLNGFDARLPSELSGGQQQRVAVARALVLEPAVLLFDEPLSNLDARLRREMRDEIRDLQQRLKLTVVYVTHDQAEAMAISDRIIVMNKAVIAQQGTPRELYARPVDAFVASFMGEANLLHAQVVSSLPGQCSVQLGGGEGEGHALTLPCDRTLATGAKVEIAVRPEAVTVTQSGPGLPGKVLKSSYFGGWIEYTLSTAAGQVFVVDRRQEDLPMPAGAGVFLNFSGPGVIVLPT
jgi:iron(III) transport system ATP-binding protein